MSDARNTLCLTPDIWHLASDFWLGRKDSNLRMPVPKTGALPLGYAPSSTPRPRRRRAERRQISGARERGTRVNVPAAFPAERPDSALLRFPLVKDSEDA